MTKTHPLTGRVQRDPEPQFFLAHREELVRQPTVDDTGRRFFPLTDYSGLEKRLLAEYKTDPAAFIRDCVAPDFKPTKSPALFVQQFGRALRPYRAKRETVAKLIRSGHLPAYPSERDLRMVSWRRPL